MHWKLVLLIVLAAAPGSVAVAWLALPMLVARDSLPLPIETLQFASALQSIVVVAMASAVGVFFGIKAGLRAPALMAIVGRGDAYAALRPQLLPGAIGGVLGAAVIIGFYAYAPAPLAAFQTQHTIPLIARVLYGGISEEVLLRWGLMSFLVWAGWRISQRSCGEPSATVVWLAIGLSALLFGISHLPAVAAAMGSVPASIVAYITLGNAMFGIVAGFLFWRYGLEAAITAHVLAHVLTFAVRG